MIDRILLVLRIKFFDTFFKFMSACVVSQALATLSHHKMEEIVNQIVESVPKKDASKNFSNGGEHDASDNKNTPVQKDVCNSSNVMQESDVDGVERSGTDCADRDLHVIELEVNESRRETDVQFNGNHECLSSESRNTGVGLQRLSSKDIYPDKEAEVCQTSDNSSDEECEDVYGSQNRDSKQSSPKVGFKQRPETHPLLWTDDELYTSTMHHLDVFRRNKKFCDAILQVGGREIYCHRIVVVGASRFLYKELLGEEERNSHLTRITINHFKPTLSPVALECLVDYMYTAKLVIPQGLLIPVYCASVNLKMDRVMPVCRRHIINNLDVENCVETWRLASNVEDIDLLNVVAEYIEEHFELVTKSNEFLALPKIRMVTLSQKVAAESSFHVIPHDSNVLSQLAMGWVKNIIQLKGGNYMEDLTEQIQRLTVEELTNVGDHLSNLHDQSNQERRPVNSTDNPGNNSLGLTRSLSEDSLSSSNKSSGPSCCQLNGQWNIISSMPTTDHVIMLCCLGDVLSTLTLHLTSNMNSVPNFNTGSGSNSSCISASSSSSHSCTSSVGSVTELSHLTNARCAAGMTVLNGKIYALGGYNQSECLDTVECYDPVANRWSPLARMAEKRARFSAAVLRGQIYAVGGSTGSKDQSSMEKYDPVADKWSAAPSLPMRCSGAGVAVLGGCLYCIGGVQQTTGVAGLKICHKFNPEKQAWCQVASLNTGRSLAGASVLNDFLYCVGGTDGWTSLTSVECYDGEKWTFIAPLKVPRRGAGLTTQMDKLYCIGGSDGGSFWSSMEEYSPVTDAWTVVRVSLTLPRSNVGLVSLNGLLFAVGGYSGRQFLSSIETLDESGEVWTTHDTHVVASLASLTA